MATLEKVLISMQDAAAEAGVQIIAGDTKVVEKGAADGLFINTDVAPLNGLIQTVLEAAPQVHVLRDPTRGGLATTLNEIAHQSNVNITIEEKRIPVQPAVRAASEMLGFDPLYIANEGKLIVIVPAEQAEAALAAMRAHPYGRNAMRIGEVKAAPERRVLLHTLIGGHRILDMLAGEMLPRIC